MFHVYLHEGGDNIFTVMSRVPGLKERVSLGEETFFVTDVHTVIPKTITGVTPVTYHITLEHEDAMS